MSGAVTSLAKPVRGFTLVELLVTMAVMAVLASLAIPSFRTQMANSRLEQAAVDLSSALANARSQAQVMRRVVDVRPAAASADPNWNSQPTTVTKPAGTNAILDSAAIGKVSWYTSYPSQVSYVAAQPYQVMDVVTVDPNVVVSLTRVDGSANGTARAGLSFDPSGALQLTGGSAVSDAQLELSHPDTARKITIDVYRNGSLQQKRI